MIPPDTADIFADAPPSTSGNVFPEDTQPPKRERSKDTSPMAQAKLATTQLRVLDARKGRALQACDKLTQEVAKLDEQRNTFILTLPEKVVDILKAGGVL
jgi:hypothetical protein